MWDDIETRIILDEDIEYDGEDRSVLSSKRVLKIFDSVKFKWWQLNCIDAIKSNSDCFISLPAGSGKSFCFQAAGLMTPGLTLVVCHAKNIIYDQVFELKTRGIKAEYILDWNTNRENNERVMKDLWTTKPKTKFLYVCPERLEKQDFMNVLSKLEKQDHLSRIVIDEVLHLVLPEDPFRPAFRHSFTIRDDLPGVPIIALTGACHPENRNKVIGNLRLTDPIITQSTLNRSNIRYIVKEYNVLFVDRLYLYIEKLLKRYKCPNALVYCSRQTDCEDIVNFFNGIGRKAAALHGKTNDADRIEIQNQWKSSDQINVLCVTTAAFATINHPSVGLIIHMNVPQSIEHYQLQTNQAGRNGSQAVSVILYDGRDPFKLSLCNKSDEKLNVSKLVDFCRTSRCRREKLMVHYRHPNPKKCKSNALCDNCEEEPRLFQKEKEEEEEDSSVAS